MAEEKVVAMERHVPRKRNERSGRPVGCPAVSLFLGLTNYLVLGIVASALAIATPVYFAPDGGWLVAKPAFAAGNGGGSGGNGGGGGGGSGGGDSGDNGNGGGNAGGGDGNNGNNGSNDNNGNNGDNGNNGNGNAGGAGVGDDGSGGDDGDTSDDGAASDVADDGASPSNQWSDDALGELTDDELEAYVLYGDGVFEGRAGASAIAQAAVLDRDEEAQMIEAGWTALN